MPDGFTTIPVSAPGAPAYEVLAGAGLLAQLGPALNDLVGPGRRAFLVYDRDLPHEHVAEASRSLAHHGYAVSSVSVVAAELEKSMEVAERVLQELAITRHERRDIVVALGGGITGDLAGFVAATYRRGVPCVQIPTTLLAMVDASVGGKTGVNLATERGLLKNFVGAFHQPVLVAADVRTLGTLSDRHLRAGLAECVKHGLIGGACGDAGLLEWMLGVMPRFLGRDEKALTELVARNVALKARVVADDPREERATVDEGRLSRMLLNLGHTFGHAIETLPSVSIEGAAETGILHGEGVALGLLAACAAGESLGVTEADATKAAREAISAAGLPTRVIGLPPSEDVARRMLDDKKTSDGLLRLVLPTSLGQATIVQGVALAAAARGVDAIRQ